MCTNFSITAEDEAKSVIVARTQEFFVQMTPSIFFSARNSRFTQDIRGFVDDVGPIFGISEKYVNPKVPSPEALFEWTAKHDFIAMSDNGKTFVVDGVNSQGLTTGMMTLTMSRYQELDATQYGNTLLFPYLAAWILSMCKNCQEVIDKLDYSELRLSHNPHTKLVESVSDDTKIRVSNPFVVGDDFPVATISHFPVRDKDGNAIVLEYIDGKLIITDLNPIGVLTNDPQIAFQQQNLINNYSFVTPFNLQTAVYAYGKQEHSKGISDLHADEPVFPATRFNAWGSVAGCGFSAIPGGSSPVDRFVRTAMMVNFATRPKTSADAMNLAYHIANTVDIPVGTSRKDPSSTVENGMDSTLFLTVCNLNKGIYTIRAYGSPSVFKIDLKELKSVFQGLNGKTFHLPITHQYFDITKDIKNLANVPAQQLETV